MLRVRFFDVVREPGAGTSVSASYAPRSNAEAVVVPL